MKYPTTEDVLRAGMTAFNLSLNDIRVRSRKRKILRPRQVVQWMCKRMDTDCLEDIAIKTGVFNHATVLHSYHLIDGHVAIYGDVADIVRKLEESLYYAGFNTGPRIDKANPIDWYDPDIRPNMPNRSHPIPVKITDKTTDESWIAPSIREASRMTGVNKTSISLGCRKLSNVRGDLKFEYDE